ncbi:VOC family protein [Nicoliella spurrieriana]|uniref:VOC family protein n=1 Tax=Nicoliella spurrieriana TaxID=2925830 RepID=A0A976RR26_9LACO|nr:VOC family protein [Nicoliella spurrieriana]UQS86298.1 VOC family protein [Nicoliella spurrieriana]
MKIKDIDHITIPVSDLKATMRFYHEVFDLPIATINDEQLTIQVGHQKIIFVSMTTAKQASMQAPTPGANCISLIVKDSLDYVTNHLANYGVDIVTGPKEIMGSNGKMQAVTVYDPDHNLIQLCETK